MGEERTVNTMCYHSQYHVLLLSIPCVITVNTMCYYIPVSMTSMIHLPTCSLRYTAHEALYQCVMGVSRRGVGVMVCLAQTYIGMNTP